MRNIGLASPYSGELAPAAASTALASPHAGFEGPVMPSRGLTALAGVARRPVRYW